VNLMLVVQTVVSEAREGEESDGGRGGAGEEQPQGLVQWQRGKAASRNAPYRAGRTADGARANSARD